jgi:regulator of sirC expression with transglutaminase-like and TPR domain
MTNPLKIISLLLLIIFGCRENSVNGLSSTKLSHQFAETKSAASEVVKPAPVLLSAEIGRLAALVRSELGDSALAVFSTAEIDKIALGLSSRLFMVTDAGILIPALNKTVFHDAGMTFDPQRNRLSSLFPHTAVDSKKGSCLGLSLVYLLIAEKLDLPLHGVLAPGHFFVRFDDGTMRVNIDPMKNGESKNDRWYRERFGVKRNAGYMLSSLEKSEVAAVLAFNVGNILRERNRCKAAVDCYLQTVQVLPRWGEAWGNLGVAYDAMGSGDKALAMFEKARQVDPDLKDISRNLGSLFVKQKQYDRAAAEYERGLDGDPNSPDLLYGLAYATYCVHDFERATTLARQALAIRSNFTEARALLEKASAHHAD